METTEYKWQSAMMDADFAFKLNRMNNVQAIEEYVPLLIGKLYIHEHVYENEILVPKRTKDQFNSLVEVGKAEVVSVDFFKDDPLSMSLYEATIELLKSKDLLTVERGKNWGETVSIAFARAHDIHYFLSDERSLQSMVDESINLGNSKDIQIIRVRDFISALKEVKVKRREAYKLWMAAHERDQIEWAKRKFQNEVWPRE